MIRHRHAPARLPLLRALVRALGALFVLAVTVALPATSRAEDCPDNVPAASRERRAIAKDWFSRAEAADAGGDPIGAVRAYQCSLKMVPHAFTAFNLGRLAERTGDLELAVDAFSTYIKLAPEAPDRKEIEEKIGRMGERIKALREEQAPTQPVVAPKPPTPEPPLEVKPPPPSDPSVITPPNHEQASSGSGSDLKQMAPWIIGGVGLAALAGGLVLNLSARGKMDECRKLAEQDKPFESTCDAAKPRAYASYALFGVTAAAAITDAILIVMSQREGSQGAERHVSAAPLPGGAAVFGHFRF